MFIKQLINLLTRYKLNNLIIQLYNLF